MRVRLLGPVDAVDHGVGLAVPGQRRRSVLAALALRHGEPVSPDKLIDTVWDEPPGTPRNTVQAHVAGLRRVVGASTLTYRAPGYVLTLETPGTDVAEAHTLAERTRKTSEQDERIDLLSRARGLWRGRALADVAESAYFSRHRDVLDELHADLGEQLYAERLRRGDHLEVLAELEAEQLELPHREKLARLLMVALYRCGRQGDALAVHDRLVAVLRYDLDAPPAAATQRLHSRIRDHDPDLLVPAGRADVRRPPAGQDTADTATLPPPHPASGLVGRDDELALARTLLARSSVVTLVGMGGVGKSTLAAHLVAEARRSGQQAVSVDLTSVDAARVPTAVAAALAIPVPEDQTATEVVETVGAALATRELLVHLDNCEPVVAAVAELVTHVAGVAPAVTFLATSREPLHVLAEERLPLECLAVPDRGSGAPEEAPALQLLAKRARAADPAWRLTAENLPALVEICRAVEGLPLGLEIIGSRLRSLTAGELADELAGRLLAWRHLGRTIDARHRSLGSLMHLSYGLLSEEEAAALDQLSTTHGAPLADLADLCHDDPVVGEELVLRLVDRSLVRRSEVEGQSWVTLHEMVRTFARERLESRGELDRARSRHARWVCDRVAVTTRDLHGPHEAVVLSRLLAEQGNLDAALDHAFPADGALLGDLVTHLWWFWFRTGQSAEGLARVRGALDCLPPGAATRPMVLAAGAYLAWVVDDYDTAGAWASSALDADPEEHGAATALAHGALARVLGEQGEFEAAAKEASRSAEVYRARGDAWGVAWSRRCRASALVHAGRPIEAWSGGCSTTHRSPSPRCRPRCGSARWTRFWWRRRRCSRRWRASQSRGSSAPAPS
jgi:predicted ATPase/DNA-binding SARP family transcriptional activator